MTHPSSLDELRAEALEALMVIIGTSATLRTRWRELTPRECEELLILVEAKAETLRDATLEAVFSISI